MNVKEILHRPSPITLYHYTTQAGLLGIINDKEIWASHTQYLNDLQEFRHAVALAKEELSVMRMQPLDVISRGLVGDMEEALEPGVEGMNVCVCSFSDKGDDLSQWRAYGGEASGFAIGFSGAFLRELSEEYGWLVPVLYNEDEQRLFIRALLRDVL